MSVLNQIDEYTNGWDEALDHAALRLCEITSFGNDTKDSFAIFIKQLKIRKPQAPVTEVLSEEQIITEAHKALLLLTEKYRRDFGIGGAWDAELVSGEKAVKTIDNYFKTKTCL
jgi:hypothetical protein